MEEEWAAFLDSPFFNIPSKIQRLGKYLLTSGLSPDQPPTMECLHLACFPDATAPSHQQVYDALSQLRKYFYQFLTAHQLKTSPRQGYPLLIEGLSALHADKAVIRQMKAIRTKAGDILADQDDALSRMLVSHQGAMSFARMQLREQDESLQQVIEDTDQYYLLSRIKYSCERLNRQRILPEESSEAQETYPVPGLNLWPDSCLASPLISMYLKVWDMLSTGEETAFFDLRSLLQTYAAEIGEEEAISLYAYAQNFCIQRVNTGNPVFLEELFSLYQDTLSGGLLTRHGEMDHRQYKNIATVAFRLSRYEWVRQFLQRYKDFLPDKYRDNAFRMNMASLHYEEGRFREALQLLQQLEFTDVYYQLSARVLTLKIYFEQEDDESLEHLFSTFRMFLQRNKSISTYQRQIHLNLVRATRKLYQIRTRAYRLPPAQYKEKITKLIQKSRETGNITNLSWLLSRATEMQNAVKSA